MDLGSIEVLLLLLLQLMPPNFLCSAIFFIKIIFHKCPDIDFKFVKLRIMNVNESQLTFI